MPHQNGLGPTFLPVMLRLVNGTAKLNTKHQLLIGYWFEAGERQSKAYRLLLIGYWLIAETGKSHSKD